MRPVIGLTCGRRMITSSAGETRAHAVYTTYTTMVHAAGGIPLILVPVEAEYIDRVLDGIDGLLLTGGGDVDPARYGGASHETVYDVDPARDEFELAVARRAAARAMPTLAICRGMQVLNVAFGGTLIEDLASEPGLETEHRRHGHDVFHPQHHVRIEPASALARTAGSNEIEVNTIHHQALREVAPALTAVGWSPDGVIEAIEPTDARWRMIGVQWHPEYLGVEDRPSLGMFVSLVEAAGGA